MAIGPLTSSLTVGRQKRQRYYLTKQVILALHCVFWAKFVCYSSAYREARLSEGLTYREMSNTAFRFERGNGSLVRSL